MKFARALASKVYVSAIVGALWYGGQRIAWPDPARLIGGLIAVVVVAALAHFFAYWTRRLGDGIRFVEVTIRVLLWLGILAAVVLWMIAEPRVGILGGALVAYMAGDTWREQLTRWFRRLRFEDVALRRDDPNYRPATIRALWPPK
jgi:hypothetical protein